MTVTLCWYDSSCLVIESSFCDMALSGISRFAIILLGGKELVKCQVSYGLCVCTGI